MSGPSDEKPPSNARGSAPNDESAQDGIDALSPAEMAQAFRDLARGEQQAAALEANLTNLESKLDALLASIEQNGEPASSDQDKAPESKEDKDSGEKKV